jgi:tetratricopeptide (TPR) repeat protein
MIQSAYYLVKSAYMRSNNRFDSALYYANKSVDVGCRDTAYAHKSLISALSRLTVLYAEAHQNDSAIKYGYIGLNLAAKYNYKLNEAYSQMVVLYQNIGDTVNLRKSIMMSLKDSDVLYKPAIYNNVASLYQKEKKYDSAFYFMNKAIVGLLANNDSLRLGIIYSGLAELYNDVGKYDSALYYITIANNINQKYSNEAPEDFALLATLFVREQNNAQAILAYEKMLEIAIRDSIEPGIIAAYQKLGKQYLVAKDYKNAAVVLDSGYSSLLKFKDNNFISKLNALESDYRIKNKQLEIDKINVEKNATTKTIKLQKYLLLVFALLLGVVVFAVYQNNKRRKLKLEKDKIESEKELIELEQRLLRSQMNPHFIFNAIAGIRGNILNDEKEKAVFYLSKFSKLLRQILESSVQVYVSLTEEINTIENYIALQQMRYENKFTYQINIDDDIDTDNIEIPSLLIQPFIENSIEHGFNGITYVGKIDINIQKSEPKMIEIIIYDNGKGLGSQVNNDDIQDMKGKSVSLEIIKMQLAIISKNSGIPSRYTINKNTETNGTTVVLQIGLK